MENLCFPSDCTGRTDYKGLMEWKSLINNTISLFAIYFLFFRPSFSPLPLLLFHSLNDQTRSLCVS